MKLQGMIAQQNLAQMLQNALEKVDRITDKTLEKVDRMIGTDVQD